MNVQRTDRGFELIEHGDYVERKRLLRLVQQSSAVGYHDDAMSRPGSSFLWFGEHHHLNREEVAELIEHLQAWVETGSLMRRIDGKVDRKRKTVRRTKR